MSHTAELIAVGTELLLGNIANTDAQMISQGLSELGINVFYHTVVGDNPDRVRQAVDIAKKRADILITTGGLGPTCDDLTKVALAQAFGRKLFYHEPSAQRIRDRFAAMGRPVTENNYQQAMIPEGATVLDNDWGTAPGVAFAADGVHVIMLPGPPKEMIPMFTDSAMPYLSRYSGKTIVSHTIHFFGIGESLLESRMHEYMLAHKNPSVAPYAKDGEVQVRVTASAPSHEEAEQMLQPVVAEICRDYGKYLYGVDIGTMQKALVAELQKKHLTIAVAEGASGGNLAKRITDVPGSDQGFEMGVVTNTARAREVLAGVDAKVMETYGVYSQETARAMAQGIRRLSGADISVAITARTGLESDSAGQELGLAYIAVDSDAYQHVTKVDLAGNRSAQSEFVRYVSSSSALWNGLKAAWKSEGTR